jgi:hypothetical protein
LHAAGLRWRLRGGRRVAELTLSGLTPKQEEPEGR